MEPCGWRLQKQVLRVESRTKRFRITEGQAVSPGFAGESVSLHSRSVQFHRGKGIQAVGLAQQGRLKVQCRFPKSKVEWRYGGGGGVGSAYCWKALQGVLGILIFPPGGEAQEVFELRVHCFHQSCL